MIKQIVKSIKYCKSSVFKNILRKSIMTAATGETLVIIGIEPTHPETGYGYIHFGNQLHTYRWGSGI